MPTDPEWAASLQPGWQEERRMKHMRGPQMSEEDKVELAKLPREEKIRRQENPNIEHMMRIHRRIDEIVKDKATAEALKPWYMYLCKRPCYDDDYLPAFNLPNVHLVDTNGKGITEITEKGPVFEGRTYPLDVLIYATGFRGAEDRHLQRDPRRRRARDEREVFDGMRTVFGVHTHGYPNMFIMGGYQASFQFNLTFMLQTQGDHIAECIKYVRDHGHTTIDAKPETEEWWVGEVIKHRGKHQPQQGMHARLLQFRGRVQPPAGRQLQRRLPAILRAHDPPQEGHEEALQLRLRCDVRER